MKIMEFNENILIISELTLILDMKSKKVFKCFQMLGLTQKNNNSTIRKIKKCHDILRLKIGHLFASYRNLEIQRYFGEVQKTPFF